MNRLAVALALVLSADASPAEDLAIFGYAQTVIPALEEVERIGPTDPRAAAAILANALALGAPQTDEGWQIRADLYASLVSHLLAAKLPADALVAARAGLKEAQVREAPDSPFVAQLWLRLGEALEANHDDEGAVDAYTTAIDVAKKLLAERRSAP